MPIKGYSLQQNLERLQFAYVDESYFEYCWKISKIRVLPDRPASALYRQDLDK